MSGIYGFQNDYRWLSNFAWCKVIYEDVEYPTVEHAYVAAKTDNTRRKVLISMAATPAEAKRMGKNPTHIRSDWESVKQDVMFELLVQKYSQPKFMELLLDTGDQYIEETNHWNDTFWGVCNGVGENRLGKMIMDIREHLIDITRNT